MCDKLGVLRAWRDSGVLTCSGARAYHIAPRRHRSLRCFVNHALHWD
jgi:hypothetical protein